MIVELNEISKAIIADIQKIITPTEIINDVEKAKMKVIKHLPIYRTSAAIYIQGVYDGMKEMEHREHLRK